MKMSCLKNLFVLVIISVFCFSLKANAQIPQFGAKVGLNLSTVYGNNIAVSFPNNEVKPGLVVGTYMTYDLVPLLSIQPEVLFSMKGTKGSSTTVFPIGMSYNYEQTFNYLEVPLLLKVNLPLGPAVPFKTSVYAGPDFAFNVASSDKITAGGTSYTVDTRNITESFNFNVAVGAGAGFNVGPTTLGLELRYTFGTGSLTKTPDAATVRNGVFAVMISAGI